MTLDQVVTMFTDRLKHAGGPPSADIVLKISDHVLGRVSRARGIFNTQDAAIKTRALQIAAKTGCAEWDAEVALRVLAGQAARLPLCRPENPANAGRTCEPHWQRGNDGTPYCTHCKRTIP